MRRFLIVLATAGLLAAIPTGLRLAPLVFEANSYSAVVSIEKQPEFQNADLLARAWAMPVASEYRRDTYEFQENPSYCGPASVANLLHSLGIKLSQDEVIRGTPFQPWFSVLLGGMTLDQLADLLRQRLDRPLRVVRDLSLDAFREAMTGVNDPGRRVVVNFHRGPLFGRGHGHFSPVLAYLPDRDLVLVGDVNRDYRPFLVSTEALWKAVATIDGTSGTLRGLIMVDVALQTKNRPQPGG